VELDDATWACSDTKPTLLDLNDPEWPRHLGRRFPVVVAMEVIEHLENPRQFVRNLHAGTEPGGISIVTTPNICCGESVNLLARKGALYCFDPNQYFQSGHISPTPWWNLEQFGLEAGFSAVRIGFVGTLDKTGIKRAVITALNRIVRVLSPPPVGPVSGDGIVTVAVMEKT